MNFLKLKQFMDSLTDWIVPGNNVIVYRNNEKVFEYSSGYADLENKIPMSTKNHLNLYSCSKVATVTAGLQLLEAGKILLNDPLYDYIPEFREMYVKTESGDLKKAENPIRIKHLFTMQAGFSYDMNTPAFQKAKELTNGNMDTLTVLRCLAEEPLLFEPGEHFNYSLCHDVLAGLVETVSGQRFSEYMKENIFLPLGMEQTCYHPTSEVYANMAEQYRYEVKETDLVELQKNGSQERGVVVNAGKENYLVPGEGYDSGGAGIVTTPEEYALFVAALANQGLGLNGNRILSSQTVKLLKTNQLEEKHFADFNWVQMIGYGYGLGVRTMMDCAKGGSNGSVGEFGWGGAAGASVLVDTDLKLGVFYAHHMLNPQEHYYQPRLRNVVYSCLDD